MKATRKYTVFPPETVNELTREIDAIANEICCAIERKCGIRPHSERKKGVVIVVWPDGEITNKIEVFCE